PRTHPAFPQSEPQPGASDRGDPDLRAPSSGSLPASPPRWNENGFRRIGERLKLPALPSSFEPQLDPWRRDPYPQRGAFRNPPTAPQLDSPNHRLTPEQLEL